MYTKMGNNNIQMGDNNIIYLFIGMPCANKGRTLSAVRISTFTGLRRLMQNRSIGIGSTPIGNEGFAHPSARLRGSKTKLVLHDAHRCTQKNIYQIKSAPNTRRIRLFALYDMFMSESNAGNFMKANM
jgi:hypothetical protein